MIKIKTVLLVANVTTSGKYITEGACKGIVERFKNRDQTITVTDPSQRLVLGKVINLYYDEEKKIVIGDLELSINFIAGGKVLQDLKTPQGINILECDIANVIMEVRPYGEK